MCVSPPCMSCRTCRKCKLRVSPYKQILLVVHRCCSIAFMELLIKRRSVVLGCTPFEAAVLAAALEVKAGDRGVERRIRNLSRHVLQRLQNDIAQEQRPPQQDIAIELHKTECEAAVDALASYYPNVTLPTPSWSMSRERQIAAINAHDSQATAQSMSEALRHYSPR